MARRQKKIWPTDLREGLSRRDRSGCEYSAYIPDPLASRTFVLEGKVAAEVVDAESAIRSLNEAATSLVDTEALARLLLRAESVASSRIEGLEVGGRRLLRAEAARQLGESITDVTAEEVLGNIEAMQWAVGDLTVDSITVDSILEVHARLLRGTRHAAIGGVLRSTQNWIGGSDFNPCSADYVPPPPKLVRRLLDDLARFCNDDSLPAVAQAAIAHAQFESIHPFGDGNGRTGRALIHAILRRRQLTPRVLPPVSLVLATWAKDYVRALNKTRYVGPANAPGAIDGINDWIALFAAACRRSVKDATDFEQTIDAIRGEWRTAAGNPRRDSAASLLIEVLPGAPIVTVGSAASLIKRSYERTNEAMGRLEDAGAVRNVKVGRRNRAFEAPAVIDAFTDLERQLASPSGDTAKSPPKRRTPARSTRS
ncbi:MAG: Fic family protein [Actinomycetota bacterium]|nr:Fic family protein [Actinomycetota bacterium]